MMRRGSVWQREHADGSVGWRRGWTLDDRRRRQTAGRRCASAGDGSGFPADGTLFRTERTRTACRPCESSVSTCSNHRHYIIIVIIIICLFKPGTYLPPPQTPQCRRGEWW